MENVNVTEIHEVHDWCHFLSQLSGHNCRSTISTKNTSQSHTTSKIFTILQLENLTHNLRWSLAPGVFTGYMISKSATAKWARINVEVNEHYYWLTLFEVFCTVVLLIFSSCQLIYIISRLQTSSPSITHHVSCIITWYRSVAFAFGGEVGWKFRREITKIWNLYIWPTLMLFDIGDALKHAMAVIGSCCEPILRKSPRGSLNRKI